MGSDLKPLDEEKASDEKLSELSGEINAKANEGEEGSEEADAPQGKSGAKKRSRSAT